MRTITVILGGKEYTIRELPVRKNAAWRAELRKPFGEMATLIQEATNKELNDGAGLAGVIREATGLVLGSVDTISDLVFAYSAELAAQRAAIEDELYESEIQEAFVGVLGLAFPFTQLGRRALTTLQAINSLSANKPTTTN